MTADVDVFTFGSADDWEATPSAADDMRDIWQAAVRRARRAGALIGRWMDAIGQTHAR